MPEIKTLAELKNYLRTTFKDIQSFNPETTLHALSALLEKKQFKDPELANQAIQLVMASTSAYRIPLVLNSLRALIERGLIETPKQISLAIELGTTLQKPNSPAKETFDALAEMEFSFKPDATQTTQLIELGLKIAKQGKQPNYTFNELNAISINSKIQLTPEQKTLLISSGAEIADKGGSPTFLFEALRKIMYKHVLTLDKTRQFAIELTKLRATAAKSSDFSSTFNELIQLLENNTFTWEDKLYAIRLGTKSAEKKISPHEVFAALNLANTLYLGKNTTKRKDFLLELLEKGIEKKIPLTFFSDFLDTAPNSYDSKEAQHLSLKLLDEGILPTPALVETGERQDPSKFLATARKAFQSIQTNEPDFSNKLDCELFFSHLKNKDLTYSHYQKTVKKIAESKFWEKKAALFPTLKITARLAERFYPKLVKEKTAKLQELLAQKNAESLQQKALNQLGIRPSQKEPLKKTALKLQISHDNGEIKADELLHDLHEQIALQDQQLHNRVNNQDAEESLPALVELYSDRLHDAKIETLSNAKRLKNLVKKHDRILKENGIETKLKPDFDFLAQYYEKHAKAKELHARFQTQYQERLAEIKKENQEQVSQAQGKREQEEIISQTAEKISGLKAEFQPKLQELKEIQETGNQKTFQQLLNELHSSNDFTKKARQTVETLYKKTTTTQSGKQTTLTLDFKPSVRDAFTGWYSNDCTKGNPLMFAEPSAHNVKVFQGKKHVGNVYLLDYESERPTYKYLGKILHIDAIQTPIKVDMPHFTKELVETLWRQAKKQGFKALTANENLELVSNHPSVRQGFKQNYPQMQQLRHEIPEKFKSFQSYSMVFNHQNYQNETQHIILKQR